MCLCMQVCSFVCLEGISDIGLYYFSLYLEILNFEIIVKTITHISQSLDKHIKFK